MTQGRWRQATIIITIIQPINSCQNSQKQHLNPQPTCIQTTDNTVEHMKRSLSDRAVAGLGALIAFTAVASVKSSVGHQLYHYIQSSQTDKYKFQKSQGLN